VASFFAMYSKPEDVEGFERYYREEHMPLAGRTPGLTGSRVARITGTPRGTDAPHHLVAELIFEDDDALRAALAGDHFRAVGKDAMEMCQRFGAQATMMLAEDF
jgi:uncharacterized protein (TIGR02118 family)